LPKPVNYGLAVTAKLYGTPPSPPSHTARLLLERKGIEHKVIWLLPGLWPALMRTRGFRGGTVPGLKMNGRRIQNSRAIARALEQSKPDPPLFPADPELRVRVEEAERWGEEVLQDVPRRIVRWLALHRPAVRTEYARQARMPAPRFAAWINIPAARHLARKVGANDERVRETISEVPATLDHVDGLISDGVIGGTAPNAADLQVATSVRALMDVQDLMPVIRGRPAERLANSIIPDFPAPTIPAGNLPEEWLAALGTGNRPSR
jgi:glutathione S-transferase